MLVGEIPDPFDSVAGNGLSLRRGSGPASRLPRKARAKVLRGSIAATSGRVGVSDRMFFLIPPVLLNTHPSFVRSLGRHFGSLEAAMVNNSGADSERLTGISSHLRLRLAHYVCAVVASVRAKFQDLNRTSRAAASVRSVPPETPVAGAPLSPAGRFFIGCRTGRVSAGRG